MSLVCGVHSCGARRGNRHDDRRDSSECETFFNMVVLLDVCDDCGYRACTAAGRIQRPCTRFQNNP